MGRLQKRTQDDGGIPRAAFSYQIMRPMSALVQAGHGGVRPLVKSEAGDGPDGVELGFAINEVLEVGRDFQVRGDVLESFGGKITDGHDVSRVHSIRRARAVSPQSHGNTVA